MLCFRVPFCCSFVVVVFALDCVVFFVSEAAGAMFSCVLVLCVVVVFANDCDVFHLFPHLLVLCFHISFFRNLLRCVSLSPHLLVLCLTVPLFCLFVVVVFAINCAVILLSPHMMVLCFSVPLILFVGVVFATD